MLVCWRRAVIAERPATFAIDVVVVDVAAEHFGAGTGYHGVSGYWADME